MSSFRQQTYKLSKLACFLVLAWLSLGHAAIWGVSQQIENISLSSSLSLSFYLLNKLINTLRKYKHSDALGHFITFHVSVSEQECVKQESFWSF